VTRGCRRSGLLAPGLRVALALALTCVGAGPVRGDRNSSEDKLPRGALRDRAHRYQIVIAPGWRPVASPDGTLIAYSAEGGRGLLAVTRIDAGTRAASDPAALAAQVERGVERATRDFRRLRRKLASSHRATTLDLSYQRSSSAGRERVLSRYLFFTRHTVVLSIGLRADASRSERRAAEAMVRSFGPF